MRAIETEPTTVDAVSVQHLSKTYVLEGRALLVLQDISFGVRPGEFVSFVGPSGSGKSTLLNIITGLEAPDSGAVMVAGSPQRLGRTAYMPQSDSLLPWRSALDNAVLGLEIHGVPRREARERARELFAIAGLAGFEGSRPDALSGGMRQRVAFLRTVLTGGDAMLLDEPFGALDALTRSEMQGWLLDLLREVPRSVILVTHDVEEALRLSDRVYVMTSRPGRIRLAYDVPLPRPRGLALIATEEFARARLFLLDAVRGGS